MENRAKLRGEKLSLKARKVKMLILDIDGVMTDGRIIYDNKGNELKCFNVLDGMGLALLYQAGIKVALITAKGSKAVLRRAADIGAAEVKQNAVHKLVPLQQILKKHHLTNEDICFVGDDLVDMPIMKRAGLAVAVANACAEVKQLAHYVTDKEGGKGAVREVIEIILRAQNKWDNLIKKFLI
ncbi:MAG: HAD-IIIA family hydrolase [Candidatus Omnitrophota bacterium]